MRDLSNGWRRSPTAIPPWSTSSLGPTAPTRPSVRSSPVLPTYTGVTGAEISIAPEDTQKPELQDAIESLDGDDHIRTYAWFPAPADWTLASHPAEMRKVLLEMFKE
ncbi:hypothetical protein BD311DRAFT_812167 [Dichomitus squalens]|uniref:Uncharacterized protein n=1 Tax=Dichomitus squalens TaxID=114155 RepID=A0A4Q9M698_9APHY|nr:hypothetical protein BD311DRAFT_812167 [Dichomitus squalens]